VSEHNPLSGQSQKAIAEEISPRDTNDSLGKRRNRTQAFLAAFRETASVTAAAEAAGIGRDQHYRRLRKDPLYRAAFGGGRRRGPGARGRSLPPRQRRLRRTRLLPGPTHRLHH